MADPEVIAAAVAAAPAWSERVAIVRHVPEQFGLAQQQAVYARIAERAYVPQLAPAFSYVHWRPEYELDSFTASYMRAHDLTQGFTRTGVEDLASAIKQDRSTLDVFRVILGLTPREFKAVRAIVIAERGVSSKGTIAYATAIDLIMRGEMFLNPPVDSGLRLKLDKPDTIDGWATVRQYAENGVPFPMFLHQRHYGGAFRQLLDATSSKRGDILEIPVEELFRGARVPYVRTGSHKQSSLAQRFNVTVRPAPDFVLYTQGSDALRALLECKAANDGGTARDKAARFAKLRVQAERLGVPLFAVLGGLGWRRTSDALGPVVRDTDGRTFTLKTLPQMLDCEPLPQLIGTAPEQPNPDTEP